MIPARIERYLKLARLESLKSTHYKVGIGAVIVKGNWVVSRGYNEIRSHPLQAKFNKLACRPSTRHCRHAEISALINSRDEDIGGSTIFVYREYRNSRCQPANCRPCEACHLALRDAGVRTAYFINEKGVACCLSVA